MFEEEVARGARWLDHRVGPDWPLLTDVSKLEMSNCSSCIIGQVFGIKINERDHTGYGVLMEFRAHTDGIDPSEFGFNLPDGAAEIEHEEECDPFDDENCQHWMGLREAWEAEIKRRLDEGVALEA